MAQGMQSRVVHRLAPWLGLLMVAAAAPACAEVVQGQLELRWGDPQRVAGRIARPHRFTATLVTDAGTRVALDPAQARRAAGDLYALANRRVAIEFADDVRKTLPRRVNVIVPADRLSQPMSKVGEDGRLQLKAAVLGNTRWVTLMCKFSDDPAEQKPLGFFQAQYGGAPGELGHYWNEVSYGKINLAGSSAYGWYTLPQPRSAYVTETDGEQDADLNRLFADCTAAADPEVDFAGVQGINMMFNGDLDGYAWGGGSCTMLEGVRTCKSVTWNPPWAFNNLAPLAHEMGHGYGLPHSDNSDGDDDTYDNPWDVMSDAWSNAPDSGVYGRLPKHINVLQRDRLGWIDAPRKLTIPPYDNGARQVVLDRAGLPGSANVQMLVLTMPQQADPARTVIYTVEARMRTGDYESRLAGDAVIVHKVEDYGTGYSVDAQVPPADRANNEGSMFKVGEIWTSPGYAHWLRVDAVTASGFVVSVGRPRVTGGPLQPLRSAAAVAPPATALPAARAAPAAAPRMRMRECDDRPLRGGTLRCMSQVR